MASSPAIQSCVLPLTHSCPCAVSVSNQDDEESDCDMSKTKLQFDKSQVFLKKQFQKSLFKTYKRRFTFPGNQDKILCKKRRRFTSVVLPSKFLLGGNISDPLNLRSLEDEKVNQQLNALTPASSPVPIPRQKTQVQVLIPPNIYDPLNLNTGEEIAFNLSKHRKRKRHRKNRREDGDNSLEVVSSRIESSGESGIVQENVNLPNHSDDCHDTDSDLDIPSDERLVTDKIVSPVVPQGSPAKFFKRYHSRSFSKDEEKSPLKPIAKRRRSKTRLQQHPDYIKFCANAQKFCYGNHIVNWIDEDDVDERLYMLSKKLFYDKDVMDVGCNTGHLTFCIAEYWKPRKIIGIDIDKKLINIAQRKLRMYKSKEVSEDCDFPQSMAALYGSLAKVGVLNLGASGFPNNIAFFEVRLFSIQNSRK